MQDTRRENRDRERRWRRVPTWAERRWHFHQRELLVIPPRFDDERTVEGLPEATRAGRAPASDSFIAKLETAVGGRLRPMPRGGSREERQPSIERPVECDACRALRVGGTGYLPEPVSGGCPSFLILDMAFKGEL